eukprot:gnl/TRDRNA2_/TRDRNA2_177482_c0_seq10.p1 gnl/TRDRNA2_/TRDRNA2_177482_c0~~gnl/TRDRNA2_/TRDRNA2_177482_c0_seq10.p1  ORF type:complete len:868 (-),score=154.64 gnl/TRDRNA2_/TRDRNA2_177482_c0_seq10:277-2823(-)
MVSMVHIRRPEPTVAEEKKTRNEPADEEGNQADDAIGAWEDPSSDEEGEFGQRARVERHHKWINRQITSAAGSGNVVWLLQVVQAHLDSMNLINFSTALHRISKLALGCSTRTRNWILDHECIRQLRVAVVKHVMMLNLSHHQHGASACTPAIEGPPGLEHPAESADSFDKSEAPYHGNRFANSESVSDMRCLSIICWSCATLRIFEESLFSRVASVSKTRLAELKPFELSNMLWAFAKLSLGHAALFEGVSYHLLRRRKGEFSLQCLSTIIWAFGTAKVHNVPVFTSFATEISANAGTMAPLGIANTAWAFARVRRQELPLFRALASAAVRDSVIWSFKPQELSNTVWAFATIGLPHVPLFDLVAEVAASRCLELPPQNVANMLWAYSKLLAPARAHLFPVLLEVAASRLEQYKPQEISAILWAAAKEAGSPTCRKFFVAVPRVFRSRLPEFAPQALACMIEAFALAEVDSQNYFDTMVRESLRRCQHFEPPSLCTLFRGIALAVLSLPGGGWKQENNLRTISQHIADRIFELQLHNITHLVQTLDHLPPNLRMSCASPLMTSKVIMALRSREADESDGYSQSALAPTGQSADPRVQAQALLSDTARGRRRHGRRRSQCTGASGITTGELEPDWILTPSTLPPSALQSLPQDSIESPCIDDGEMGDDWTPPLHAEEPPTKSRGKGHGRRQPMQPMLPRSFAGKGYERMRQGKDTSTYGEDTSAYDSQHDHQQRNSSAYGAHREWLDRWEEELPTMDEMRTSLEQLPATAGNVTGGPESSQSGYPEGSCDPAFLWEPPQRAPHVAPPNDVVSIWTAPPMLAASYPTQKYQMLPVDTMSFFSEGHSFSL